MREYERVYVRARTMRKAAAGESNTSRGGLCLRGGGGGVSQTEWLLAVLCGALETKPGP